MYNIFKPKGVVVFGLQVWTDVLYVGIDRSTVDVITISSYALVDKNKMQVFLGLPKPHMSLSFFGQVVPQDPHILCSLIYKS